MHQHNNMQSTYNEADILLAISAIDQGQIQSERRAASSFSCARTTVQRRRAGTASRRDCELNLKNLTKLEEKVILNYILNLDSRGFAPTLSAV
jgi:hypothetical protein